MASGFRWLCVLCFLSAALRHTFDLWHGGWLPYKGFPLWTNMFWTALTFLDPVAALLLWLRPRLGAGLAPAIMLVDVGINTYWAIQTGLSGVLGVTTLMAQTLFLGAVMGGFPLLWSLGPPRVNKA